MQTHIIKEKPMGFPIEYQKGIENYKNAIMDLEEAILLHHEAVRHFITGNKYEAHISLVKAYCCTEHARSIQKEILKKHA
jgi:hypothetical protein